jgi:hypothetical protein
MPSERSERRPEPRPAVNPIGALERAVGRFGAWARDVGEMRVACTALALVFVLAAGLILAWGGGQTFIQDEWNYVVVRSGWSLEMLLAPQNGHLIVAPLLLYKGMLAIFGAGSHLPFQIVAVILHLTVATIFFCLIRRRLPLAAAVGLTALVALFGVCWDTIMASYEIPNLSGMAAGLGMLLALDRRTRGGDLAACALLALSLASFSVGIAFALGALVSIWLGGRTQWKRAWVVVAPSAVYLVWFLWARKFGQTEVTAVAISAIFSGMADQLAAICASVTGLYRVPGSTDIPVVLELRPDWGYPLALVLAGLVALHVRRAPRSIYFWTLAATLLVYLALVSVGLSPARTANAGRYVYMGGILTLLLIAELGRDIRWTTVSGLVAVVLLGLSLMASVAEMRAGGRLFSSEGETNRATLAAFELTRDRAAPAFQVEDGTAIHSHPDMFFPAWEYIAAVDKFGSPAFSIEQLRASGEQAREAADQELVRALELKPQALTVPPLPARGAAPILISASGGKARTRGSCVALAPESNRTAAFRLKLPTGGFSYRTAPTATVTVKLARFGDLFVTELPAATGSAEIAIPKDAAATPWRAELSTAAGTIACAR